MKKQQRWTKKKLHKARLRQEQEERDLVGQRKLDARVIRQGSYINKQTEGCGS